MKASFILRGAGGLLAALFGGVALLGAVCVTIFIQINSQASHMGINVPGDHLSTTDFGGFGLTMVFSAFTVLGLGLIAVGLYQIRLAFSRLDQENTTPVINTEDRLDDLERLKRRDMVTPEEYAAKRQDILKDL